MSEWNQKELLGSPRYSAKSTDPITGTTVNASTAVVDLDTRAFNDSVHIIANTGSNTLNYSVEVRSDYANGDNFVLYSNAVVAGDEDELILVHHARVFIFIQSDLTDHHTTFSITSIGSTT